MPSMNEWDVEDAVNRFGRSPDCPNLYLGAQTLLNLVRWTNSNSDGWPYWRKPSTAAAKLQTLLEGADRWSPVDCSAEDLKRAYTPIRAFLTKHDPTGKATDHVFPPKCRVCGNWGARSPEDCGYCQAQAAAIARRAEAVTAIENRWRNEANINGDPARGPRTATREMAEMAVDALSTIGALK